MAGFLHDFAVDGRFGLGGGMYGRAKAAGYSDKQIATAIGQQGGQGLRIGDALRPGSAMHTQMAGSNRGQPGNWIFHHMGPSGAVGFGGLQSALASGKSIDELISAGRLTAGGTKNYGIAGFGQQASAHLQGLKKDQLHKTEIEQLQNNSQALLNQAIAAIQPAEPPKPTLGTTGIGQFVPGTSRIQAQSQGSKKGSRAKTLRGRFGRDFTSPLSIAAGRGSGSSSSSVLNTQA